jgi:hypothetical protein
LIVGVTGNVGEGPGNSTVGVGGVNGGATSAGMHPARTKKRIIMTKGRMSLLVGEPCLGAMDGITLVSET